jgi:hypothetical protein
MPISTIRQDLAAASKDKRLIRDGVAAGIWQNGLHK